MGIKVKWGSRWTAGPKKEESLLGSQLRACSEMSLLSVSKSQVSTNSKISLFFFYLFYKISTWVIRRRFSVTSKFASALGWDSNMENDTVK